MPSVPGNRKTPQTDNFLDLTDDQQRTALNHELEMWRVNNLNVGTIPHNIFNMDAMVIAIVRIMTKELGIEEDVLNRHYRHVLYEKLVDIRKNARGPKLVVPNIEL